MGIALQVLGVSRHFEKGGVRVEVLRDAALSLQAGEAVAIVGESGSGKSTFLHVLGGLEAPSAGVVLVDGRSLYDRDTASLDAFRSRSVGFIFQFHHLLPDQSALDNVAIPALIARVPKAEARERARAALERVGLGHRLSHKPGELSGGEQQRVAIARALAMKPEVLLCDEPTSALDPELRGEVLQVLGALATEGMTLLLVTHELAFARDIAHRVVFLEGGRVVESGPTRTVLDTPRHPRLREFLGKDRTGRAG